MHTYRKSNKGYGGAEVWTVGHYFCMLNGTTEWFPLSDHDTENGATMRVHYLNGGAAPETEEIYRAVYSIGPK